MFVHGGLPVWASNLFTAQCHKTVYCELFRESFAQRDPDGSHHQRPVLFSREEGHLIFWIPFIAGGSPSDCLWAFPVPTCVHVFVAGYAECFGSVGAGSGAVASATGATSVVFRQTVPCKVAPALALHALHGFLLLLAGSGSGATDG